MSAQLEKFSYDDGLPRRFMVVTVVWGIVGMLVGLLAAIQLAWPTANLEEVTPWLSFGRIRPLHTNAVIFAFAGNAFFAGAYYSTQRLLKARLFSPFWGGLHFWGWQAAIVAAAVTLPLGFTQAKEYAELEWPIDVLVVVAWVAFAINFFGTIWQRRERHLYVAIWFYIASIITVAILYIFNNLAIPAGPLKSYSVYSGVQDAFMQWWYGHNAVAFFLTTPFLGLMYYYLPKAAERPVFSYKLSILHFWSLVFIYIWAGPHHLHYTALPEWASTLGMLFSVMLWMPSWGGMINGLLTLRGAWHKVAADPVLKFFVVAVTFYGMSTFEGPLLSVKSVNALSHYTDWTIAHVHGGALGWVGGMTFGMVYWMAPRVFQAKGGLWSRPLAEVHFWMALGGILFYIIPIYMAGLTQGLMWREIDPETGALAHQFIETVRALHLMYVFRVVGGLLYVAGAILCLVNVVATWASRPPEYEERVYEAPPLEPEYTGEPQAASALAASGAHVTPLAYRIEAFLRGAWHRTWEALPFRFTVYVTIAVVAASLFEIVPTFLIKSTVPKIQSVKPYTPLELLGRDIYLAEGCYNCHSQMVRPIHAETLRYGEYSKAGEFVYDHPFQWGSRRIGPDLHRVGGKYNHVWHVSHFKDPSEFNKGSLMPRYAHLFEVDTDFEAARPRVGAMAALGVPYADDEVAGAVDLAREQAGRIAGEIVAHGGPEGLADKQVVALIAYLQRLGTDIGPSGVAAADAPEIGGEVR